MDRGRGTIMEAAAKISEAARIEADLRVAVRIKLITYLSRQEPELQRDLVDYALGPALLPQEARDLTEAATGPGRTGHADSPSRAQAAGIDPVAQPNLAAQERPSAPLLGHESLVPQTAQEAGSATQEAQDLGTGSRCPRVPHVLEQVYISSSLWDTSCNNDLGSLGRGAKTAQIPLQPVPPRGEAKRPAESKQPTSPAELEVEANPPAEPNDDPEPASAELDEEEDGGAAEADGGWDRALAEESSDGAAAPPSGPPGEARALCHVGVQIWRNRDFVKRRQAEWTAKLRCMTRFDPDTIQEIYVGFRPSPRKTRETMRRHAAEGKVSDAWTEDFARLTADLDQETRVGPMTKREYKPAKNTSSNASEGADYWWAAMVLDASGSAPQHLMLDFGDGEQILLDRFTSANGRARNAPQWLAVWDPGNLQGAKRDLANLRKNLAQSRQNERHSPNTALGELIAHHVKPLADKVAHLTVENDDLRREMAKRDQEAIELKSRVARLCGDVFDLKRARG